MLVLTNREKCYGDAGLLLGRDFFNEAMGGRNFYILPSSVHELILVPGERMADEYRLTQMVREVNRETVLNEEVLADHVYYYDMAVGLMAL
ncbi:MAG: DUF5688 family protein [Clostridiales bacterium]|nr:DUF5688 family protein [Clostridiales bacterium]